MTMAAANERISAMSKLRHVSICVFLVVSTLAVYWQVSDHDFVLLDDNQYVVDNPKVQAGLTAEGIAWAFGTTHASNWHPLTWLSHMLDCQLYGVSSGKHHLTNLFVHIANALLLFYAFRRMTGHPWQSAFIASLFALHPLHVESVAWVSERKDVLSTFFWMLTMWSYVWYAQRPRAISYLLVLLFFAMGLMAKSMLVTLPFVLLLLDYYPLGRIQGSPGAATPHPKQPIFRLVLEKIPLLALAAASSAMTFYAQAHGGAVGSLDVIPISSRIANALVTYAAYLLKTVCPSGLAAMYPHGGMPPWWQTSGALLLILSTSYWAIKAIKQRPYVAVGWLWYLGTLVPVIGLVQVGTQAMADRYTYIPLIGLFIIAAGGAAEIANRWHRATAILRVVAAAALLVCMALTYQQVGHWQDSITLFEHTLKVTRDNWFPHNNLGLALKEQGRIDDAIGHYQEALRIKPDLHEAHNNLGLARMDQGRIDEAAKHYRDALRIKPDYATAHSNLGLALDELGRRGESDRHHQEALRLSPDSDKTHNNLAITLGNRGDFDGAIVHFRKALDLEPRNAISHHNLANALREQDRIEEAVAHYRSALAIKPDYAEVHNNLAIALIYRDDIDGAIRHFRKAIEIRPGFAHADRNLKRALRIREQDK